MFPSRNLLPAIVLSVLCLSASAALFADSLRIDTDYRIRAVNYSNTNFDKNTSTASAAYYTQTLRLSVIGKYNENIEIGARLTAIGVAGSTSTLVATPYPKTDFTPYIENAYVRLNNLADLPVSIVAGRQNMEYGDGLIVSDNGIGFTGIKLLGTYDIPFPWEAEVFTAKLNENFLPSKDRDLYGAVGSFTWKKHLWEVGYFKEDDKSGTSYYRGATAYPTKSITKQFVDLRIGHKETISSYQLEIAKEQGSVTRAADNASINLDGLGYVLSGELIGEKTKLGRVAAHALLAIFSGEENLDTFADDSSFSPDLTRQYDGTEPSGYGALFAASPGKSFFSTAFPSAYSVFSGFDTLNVGANFTPYYGWLLGVDYFLFSASQGPKGAPSASGFERLFGAEFTLGVELDLSVKYTFSKTVNAQFIYSRYTPPSFTTYWPSTEPATRYMMEIAAKF